jgi:hypothetical protein
MTHWDWEVSVTLHLRPRTIAMRPRPNEPAQARLVGGTQARRFRPRASDPDPAVLIVSRAEEMCVPKSPLASRTPRANTEVYSQIYEVEVALRELIIVALTNLHGPRWAKRGLAPPMREKVQEARAYERRTPWTQCIPHHPLYYLNFSDLAMIMEGKANRQAFRGEFPRLELAVAEVRVLEPIRNKVAHNRKATEADVTIAMAASAKLQAWIGQDRYQDLLERQTLAPDLPQRLKALSSEAEGAVSTALALDTLEALPCWEEAREAWWFDSEYLGGDLDQVECLFGKLLGYMGLPQGRGTGHIAEAWLAESGLRDMLATACGALSKLSAYAE